MPTVVSSSAKPRSEPSAASAAICTGLSLRLVTWAWFAGNSRDRILVTAIIISSTFIVPTTSTILAGVMAVVSFTTSSRGTVKSTILRASSSEGVALTSTALSRRMP